MDRSIDLYGVWFTGLPAASASFMGRKSDVYYSFIESYVQVKGELMHNDRATKVRVIAQCDLEMCNCSPCSTL